MSDENYASRRDADQLAGWITRLEQRVDQIDSLGTRGMGAVTVQLTDLARTTGTLRGETLAWQAGHEREHERDQAARTASRRWAIGLALTNLAAFAAVLAAVIHH